MSEEVMKNISLEVVRERLLDHVHQVLVGSHSSNVLRWKVTLDEFCLSWLSFLNLGNSIRH